MKVLVRQGFEDLWNKANLDIADEILAPNFVMHYTGNGKLTGLDAYKQEIEGRRKGWEKL
jgi:hypothetical protein